MQSKHTPGPWSVVEYNEGRNMDIQDSKGAGVLTKDNARLIAAAPDLLAALELIEHAAISGMDGDMLAALQDIMQGARAAIAKARGQ